MKPYPIALTIFLMVFTVFANLASAQVISPKEFLEIEIKGIPVGEQEKINGRYVVTPSGHVFLPMIKDGIKASGMTSAALSRNIESAFKKAEIYQNPRIMVVSKKDIGGDGIDAQEISMAGHVKKNGAVAFKRGMTLQQAIAAAGGVTPFGTIKKVELYRDDKKTIYDLRKDVNKRIKVKPGDTIVIPQKGPFDGQ